MLELQVSDRQREGMEHKGMSACEDLPLASTSSKTLMHSSLKQHYVAFYYIFLHQNHFVTISKCADLGGE